MPKQYSTSKSATKEKSNLHENEQNTPIKLKEDKNEVNISNKTPESSKNKEKIGSPSSNNKDENMDKKDNGGPEEEMNLTKRKGNPISTEDKDENYPMTKKVKGNNEGTKEKERDSNEAWKCFINYSPSQHLEDGADLLITEMKKIYTGIEIIPNRLPENENIFEVILKNGTEKELKVLSNTKGDEIPSKKNIDKCLKIIADIIAEHIDVTGRMGLEGEKNEGEIEQEERRERGENKEEEGDDKLERGSSETSSSHELEEKVKDMRADPLTVKMTDSNSPDRSFEIAKMMGLAGKSQKDDK